MAGEALQITAGNAAGKQISLTDHFLIGRAADGEGTLGDDPEISREHAKITRGPDGQLRIEDLGSRNGTSVNGQRIWGPHPLRAGDTVQVGQTTLEFANPSGQETRFGATPQAGETRFGGAAAAGAGEAGAGEALRITAGNAAGKQISLTDDFLIGRAADGEGTLGDDPEISREHAKITRGPDGQLRIEDLGSRNGTAVNGQRIWGPHPLRAGDRIQVGQTTLEFADARGQASRGTRFGPTARAGETRFGGAAAAGAGHAAVNSEREPGVAAHSSATESPRARRSKMLPLAIGGLLLLLVLAGGVATLLVLNNQDASQAERWEPAPRPTTDVAATASTRIEKAKRGTVSITGKTAVFDDKGRKSAGESGGSGFVIDSARGLAVTNAHVVTGLQGMRVRINEGEQESAARVLARAPCQDLAVIEIVTPPAQLEELKLANSGALKAGDHVTALGYPSDPGQKKGIFADRSFAVTDGIVSVPNTSLDNSQGDSLGPELPSVIRHQVPISGGNSGGPLINDAGEVVGVNTAGFGKEEDKIQSQNISITSSQLKSLAPDLMAGRNQGYVGWDLATGKFEDGSTVVQVAALDAASPADKRGFVPGDYVQELNGTPVFNVGEVCAILESVPSGDQITVTAVDAVTLKPFENVLKLQR